MPGTGLAIGVVGVCATLVLGLAAVGAAAVAGQRVAGAADAAALAAADAASGAVAGVPCERASEVAQASGAALTSCRLDGLVATVTVTTPFGAFVATASSRAGPPS